MPYKGELYSMRVLLPVKGLVPRIDSSSVQALCRNLSTTKVQVSLPKFAFGADYELMNEFKKMGVKDAFSLNSDFSGITKDQGLMIGSVKHGARIEVEEKGTRAVAFTLVKFVGKCASPKTEIFNANRPFLFTVFHKESGAMLFLGRVLDPSKLRAE
jgi:serpin B